MFRSKRLASVDLQFYIPGIQRTEEGVVVGEVEEDGTETGTETGLVRIGRRLAREWLRVGSGLVQV